MRQLESFESSRPDSFSDATRNPFYQKRYQFEHEEQVHTGDFLIFPGYLKHRVKRNTSDRTRLILGVSFGCKGYYWQGNWIDHPTADLSEIIKTRGLNKF